MLNQIAAIHGTGVAAATNSYESIATVTVGAGGSSFISFSSIPSTFKHLQIRFIARDTDAGSTFDYATLQFNGDSSTANYTYHTLTGNGTSASASGNGTGVVGYNIGGYIVANGATASVYGAGVIDVLDYQNTTKYKTVRTLSGWDKNGGGNVGLLSGLWLNTSAISSIVIGSQAGNLMQYSHFALYGIKG